jgi:hypothetical protein
MCMNEWFNIISLINVGVKWNISQSFEWNNNNNKCYLSKLWKLNSQLKGLNLMSQVVQYYYCIRTQGALYALIHDFWNHEIFNFGFPKLVFERNKHFDIKPLIELVVGMVSTKL